MTDSRSQLHAALVSAATELNPNIDSEAQICRDIELLSDRAAAKSWQVAVFGPFNHGKSTLLNALLGQPLLPVDLIPTTGAAIQVRYGEALRSRVTLADGSVREDAGTDMLEDFATLDDRRTMRADVAAVEVICPHPLLEQGVELLDLPGTNDLAAQDELVKQQLLGVDLVVQVLDGRKLMTLGEREHLRDWLHERGIETVVFVVNFLNLMAAADQKEVMRRMRFVAAGFRSVLPANVVNLYRVDALPALRARLNQDDAALAASGLTAFAAALEAIAPAPGDRSTPIPRLKIVAEKVRDTLQIRAAAMATQLETASQQQRERELQRRGQMLIQQGFSSSLADARQVLSVDALCDRFQTELAAALRTAQVELWQSRTLDPLWRERKASVVEWVRRAGDLLQQPVPAEPGPIEIEAPQFPNSQTVPNAQTSTPAAKSDSSSKSGDAAVAAATGLGFLMGGPLGAAVLGGASYILNRSDRSDRTPANSTAPPPDSTGLYRDAARAYLHQFSLKALDSLQQYSVAAAPAFSQEIVASVEDREAATRLRSLRDKISVLESSLAAATE